MQERLQKILARTGAASRRGAEKIILAGRVRVNGRVVSALGQKADPEEDRIEVDGRVIRPAEALEYYIFYKPSGYITTLDDPQKRPSITQFLKALKARVYPVGRLDMDAEGLLVLTNDGELARRLMHPRFHVPKTYRVKVKGLPKQEALDRLGGGELKLGDRHAAPAEVEVLKKGTDRAWLTMTLFEGRHHQIKRMCSQVGHPVLKLKRTAYGPLTLGRLKSGGWRRLRPEEIKALKAAAGMDINKTA
ncbi:MAG: pseudouridine synthase [Pseudomonadota bacterium]